MQPSRKLPFFTLLLMISFASVNAVLFTPALPNIAAFFHISESHSQLTITWFLIGYALGQLLYGPLASRFGRKPALYVGIILQILSSFLCVSAGLLNQYTVLVLGRFLLALGSGVGLKMTFTMVNDCYDGKKSSQIISYLILAFAITPGLSIALGGVLNTHFGWMSCFYAGALYGIILLLLSTKIPETLANIDSNALQFSHLLPAYTEQFKNKQLILGGLLMGISGAFIYVFATIAPFIAINFFSMSSTAYGFANLLPSIGLIIGSLCSAKLAGTMSFTSIIGVGIGIILGGVVVMYTTLLTQTPVLYAIFIPAMIIYMGLCFILPNASSIAMASTTDKAHASAVMNFVNMGSITLIVLSLGIFSLKPILLPLVFTALLTISCLLYTILPRNKQ